MYMHKNDSIDNGTASGLLGIHTVGTFKQLKHDKRQTTAYDFTNEQVKMVSPSIVVYSKAAWIDVYLC